MKIAMIGQKGIATGAGGVEKHVEELSTRLVKLGHQVTVYYRNTFISEDIREYKGVVLKKIKTVESKSLDAIVYALKATINALFGKYDIYHYHALGPASLSFIPKLFGKKVIVTVHGLDWQRAKWGRVAKAYLKFGEFITGNFADEVISVSENTREYFIEKYRKRNKDNTVFIPNGVDINEKMEPNLISKYGLTSNNYFLFLARLVPEKGAHYLIEAYKNINTDKKLVIAGGTSFTDDYLDNLYEIAGGDPNILFTGNVNGDLLKELYSNCYLYILPSDIEGMPITLLEAMSYGKACVVSDIDENVGVVKNVENNFIFNKSSVESLTNTLEVACSIDEESMDSEETIEVVKEKYSWNKVISEYLSCLKSI